MLYVPASTIVILFSWIMQTDLVVFRGNHKFENGAESTTLSFKKSLPCLVSKVLPKVWTQEPGLLIFELYNIRL